MMPGQPGYVDLEQRAYGPDSAPEECDAIADRVSLLEERVLLMREMPVQSPFSINLMFDRLEALARDWDRRGADGGNTLSDGVHTVSDVEIVAKPFALDELLEVVGRYPNRESR